MSQAAHPENQVVAHFNLASRPETLQGRCKFRAFRLAHPSLSPATLQRHVSAKTVQAPPLVTVGGVRVRLWSDRDIKKARKVLAGIRPGRKKEQ